MSESAAKSNVVELMQEQPIVAYDPFRQQLQELKAINDKTMFQYDTVAGFTAAKSYIRKLQLTAGAIERVRKAEKAESLNYGRKVDKQAKEIEAEVRAMIEVHQKPIDEIEAREEKRIAAIRVRIDRIKAYQVADDRTSAQSTAALKNLGEVKVDESFGEFQVEVTIEIAKAIEAQTNRKEFVEVEEEVARTQAKERADAAVEAQRVRDEAIAKEAAEQAKTQAEAFARLAAERVKADHEKALQEAELQKQEAEYAATNAQIARERAEKQSEIDRVTALEAAERREREAVEAEQRRVAAEAKRVADEAAAREADLEHKKKINNEVMEALFKVADLSTETAKEIIKAIARGEIPHVKISY